MLAPFATLAFLVAFWLVAKLMVDLLAADALRIGAALRGRSVLAQPPQSVRPVSVRFQPLAISVRRPIPARPEWRAAA